MTRGTSGGPDEPPPSAQVEPIVVGRYILWDVIGGGGMAKVHVGRMLGAGGFSRTVAVKRLHSAKAAAFTSMIVDEARLASRIRHPNVVPPLDVVVSGQELLLVMEYVHGVALAKLLENAVTSGKVVPLPIAVRIVLDVLAGLEAAHTAKSERGRALDIVHRDISPQNVIVDAEGVARIVDFGIAKAEGKLVVTRAGQIKGKLGYMAPEQIAAGEVDRRADVYATGIVLWELLAGRRLFDRSPATIAADIQRVMKSPVPPPSKYRHVPVAVDAVVRRALEADKTQRFGSAAEMASALERAAPAANSRELGLWVSELAADELEQRNEVLERVEQLSAVREQPSIPPEVLGAAAFTAAPRETASNPALEHEAAFALAGGQGAPPDLAPDMAPELAPDLPPDATFPDHTLQAEIEPEGAAARVWAPVLGGLAAILVAMAFVIASGRMRDRPPSLPPSPLPPSPLTPSSLPPSSAVDEPSPPAAPVSPSDAPAHEAEPLPEPKLPKKAPPATSTKPVPPASASAKASCDPPFVIDANGFRVLRRECLAN